VKRHGDYEAIKEVRTFKVVMNHRGYSQGFEIHHIASEVKKIVRTDYFTMKQGPKK
jgi:hypothetical protein